MRGKRPLLVVGSSATFKVAESFPPRKSFKKKIKCQAQTDRTGMLGFINLKALLVANTKEGFRQSALVMN